MLCAHFEWNIALHVDTSTFANGNYEISQEPTANVPEDQMNVTKGLTEAPNQSSEDVDLLTSDPLVKASPGHIPLLYLHCNLWLLVYTYALRLGVVMKP
jgi:hypothetical protein